MSTLIQEKIDIRPIPGYPGYHAGDDGSVWSERVPANYPKGIMRKMKGRKHWKGYRTVHLTVGGGSKVVFVHTLILLTFAGPREKDKQARHLDGTRDNNRLSNLRYGTAAENEADKKRHGTRTGGRAKLDTAHAAEIKRRARQGLTIADMGELAERFGVTLPTVRRVARGRSWKGSG
jgi:hypothetical protein